MSKAIPEGDILAPRDPSTDDSTDEWPEFTLENAYVHLPGNSKAITSLLEARAGFPLTVVGQLDPLDEEDAHLYAKQPLKKRTTITVQDVYTFSYGQWGNGTPALWAAGKAGWFVIQPAKSYKSIFNKIADAINVLYFVADAYKEPRKKGKGKNATILPDYSAKELFEKYAAEELGSADASDGQEKFYEHMDFLIYAMLEGKEGLHWSKYPLYKHFYAKFPDVFAQTKQRIAGPADTEKEQEAPKVKGTRARQGSVDTGSTTSSLKRKRGRANNTADVATIDEHSETSSTVKGSLLEAASEGSSEQSKSSTAAKSRATRRTRQNSVMEQSEPVAEEPEVEEVATPAKDEDSDEETRLRARKNKSSLRPRASKAAKSASRKGGKGPAADDGEDAEDELAPSPLVAAGKRKYDDPVESRRPPKRRNSRPHDDEGIDIPTSPSTSGDADNGASDTTPDTSTLADLPLRTLKHIPDPVQEDTWICALDGCTHKVYGASNPESQRLIREHYALHAYDDDERVQMVKKLAAPNLPASHLMERVKQQAKIEGFPGSRQMASRYPGLAVVPKVATVQQRY